MVRVIPPWLLLFIIFVDVSMVTGFKNDEHRTNRLEPLRNSRGVWKVRGDQPMKLFTGRHGGHLRGRARHRRRRQVNTEDTSSGSQRRKDNLLKALTDQTFSSNTLEELDQRILEVQLNEMITDHGSSKTMIDLNKVTEMGDENVELNQKKQESVSNDLDKQLGELKFTTGLAESLEEAMDLVPKFMLPESADRGPTEDIEDAAKMPLVVMEISGDGSGSGETILPVADGSDLMENVISFTKFDQRLVAEYDEGVMKDLEIQLYEKQKQETELKNLLIKKEEVFEKELHQYAESQRQTGLQDNPREHGTEDEMEEKDVGDSEVKGQSGENLEETESETKETLPEQQESKTDKIKIESDSFDDETGFDDEDDFDVTLNVKQPLSALSKCVSPGGSRIKLLPEDLCDGRNDCKHGEDEKKERCKNKCPMGYRKCADGFQCLKENLFCNGVLQCKDRSDELHCDRTRAQCESFNMFSCDGVCRMKSFLCDHTQDCTDGEDEAGCTYEIFSCPRKFAFDKVTRQCVYT